MSVTLAGAREWALITESSAERGAGRGLVYG